MEVLSLLKLILSSLLFLYGTFDMKFILFSPLGIKPKSEMAIGGMHHMAKRSSQKSEYSHTIYSNTRSRTKKKNLERHKLRKQADNTKKLKIKKTVKKKQSDGFSV